MYGHYRYYFLLLGGYKCSYRAITSFFYIFNGIYDSCCLRISDCNLVALNPKDSCSILKSGLILVCSLALLIIFTNSIFNSYISTYYLPKISQGLFQQYFQIVSMGLLTGIIFIYVRMTSTLLDSPVSFFREMIYAFIFNVFFDLLFNSY